MPTQKSDTAKRYIELGWNLIPIQKNTKIASIEWKRYQESRITKDEVQNWFIQQDNDFALVTGRISGITVIDYDSLEAYNKYKQNSPYTVKSPHGYHEYFKYDETIKTGVGIYEKVDIRNDGAYCLLPPSNGYKWNCGYLPNCKLPAFPVGLLPTEKKAERKPEGWIAESVEKMCVGNIDDTLVSIFGRMRRDGWAVTDAIAIMEPLAREKGATEGHVESKAHHIWTAYPNQKSVVVADDNDSLASFLEDIKPIEWFCEPILGRGTITFVAGLPKTMKTWVCADLAIEVARGGMWLGKFPVHEGRVLFIDQERWKGEVQRRFKALMKAKNLDKKELEGKLILKSGTTTRFDLDDSFNAFRKRLEIIKPDLLILDSFVTFHTRQENDRQSIQIVLERIKQLRQEFGCSIIIIDHEGKGVFQEEAEGKEVHYGTMAGSVAKPAAAETILTIRRKAENESIMYHTASNLGPTIEPLGLTLKDTDGGILIHG